MSWRETVSGGKTREEGRGDSLEGGGGRGGKERGM